MYYANALKSIFSEKQYKRVAVWSFVIYVLIYLLVTQFLVISSFDVHVGSFFSVSLSPDWLSVLFRQRAPFLFESIGVIHLSPYVTLFLSVPNLILAVVLSYLVALNLAVGYFSFRILGLKGGKGVVNLLGTIPALLGGAACCVPTLILVLGLQFTATLTTVWPWFVPLSVTLLSVSLWWALKQKHVKNSLAVSTDLEDAL